MSPLLKFYFFIICQTLKLLRPVFHFGAAAFNLYALVYDQMYVNLPEVNLKLKGVPFQSRSAFITHWCLLMQTIYFFIALLNDIIGSNAPTPRPTPIIRKVKDTLFSLAFPVAIYVSLAFWGLYTFDKELIFPEHIERLFPKWLNHVMHTTVAVFIIIELLSSYRTYPSRSTGTFIMVAFNCIYILWMFRIYMMTGVWVYPIFDHLNWLARAVFIVVSACVALSFYRLGEKLNNLVSVRPKEIYTNGHSKNH